jgi:ubiquinone/menaquinone biosynthesis C-methylase UbiE
MKHPVVDSVRELTRIEEARIRAAYGKRDRGTRYSLFNPGHLFIIQRLESRLLSVLRSNSYAQLDAQRVLEIGCGTGYWLREFVKWGARAENVTGIDLLLDRLRIARTECPPRIRLQCASAAELPFRNDSFDLVLQSTVFTSILDGELRRRVAAEMMRVVKQHGIILWYDYHVNNPWNRDVRGVKRGEIHELFPDCRIELQRMTLVPPLARMLAWYSYLGCYLLEKFPPLCTHYLGVIRKR